LGLCWSNLQGHKNPNSLDRKCTEFSSVNAAEKGTTDMSAKIKLATLTALLTAFSVYGTALAQSNGNLSGHQADKTVQRLTPKIASATLYVPFNAHGSAAPYSLPAQHRSVNIVNKSGQHERDELRRLEDPNWILCHDLSIC
jgi:hypothetical protein